MQERFLRVGEVADSLRIGVTTVWEWSRYGKLPKPIKLSPRVTVWKNSEIQNFIEKSINQEVA